MIFGTAPQCTLAEITARCTRSFRSAPRLLCQDAPFNGSIGIIFAKTVQPNELFPVGRLDCRVLPPVIVHFIAGAAQIFQEGREVQRPYNDPVDVTADLRPDGRLLCLFCLPFRVAFSLSLGLDHGQSIFPAQVIRYLLNLPEIGFHIAS